MSRSAIPRPGRSARFSRFVKKLHRCPPLRDDPDRYLAFVERLLASHRFDVLLPTHEQGFLFARVQERLTPGSRARAAVLRKLSHRAQQGRLQPVACPTLRLPQPATRIVTSESALRAAVRFPAVIKTSVGTASRGVWFVREAGDLDEAHARAWRRATLLPAKCWCRNGSHGTVEKAQSVFAAASCSASTPTGRSRPASAAARRSRKASAGRNVRAHAGKDRRAARLARRALDRLSDAGRRSHAAPDRLQSAAGRADERLSCRHRSGRIAAAGLARRDARGLAGKPHRRAHPSRHAGVARPRRARRHAARAPARMLASGEEGAALRRKPRGDDAGANGQAQRGAAGDDGRAARWRDRNPRSPWRAAALARIS